ncbi:MAG: hypothetical protein IPJ88_02100 [Myxococcales bacterium]|nr:MAG: hypothetical protein IPJ88_02100 [Myxococcales bacterium]
MLNSSFFVSCISSFLATLLCFSSVLGLGCTTLSGDDVGSDNKASTGSGQYYLITPEYVGPGLNYEAQLDKLAEPYNSESKQHFTEAMLTTGGLESCGEYVGGPMYRAYTDGVQVVQYTKRAKFVMNQQSKQVSRIMIGRRLAQSDAFVDNTADCTIDGSVSKAFNDFLTFHSQGITLGEPVGNVFCRPVIDAEQSVINPLADPEYVPAQYTDYGRMLFVDGQVQLADVGQEVFDEDERFKDPEQGYVDSGYFAIQGQKLVSGSPILVARTSESKLSQTVAQLTKNPVAQAGLVVTAAGLTVTAFPSIDPISKGGGPIISGTGLVLLAVGLAVGGVATLYFCFSQWPSAACASALTAGLKCRRPGRVNGSRCRSTQLWLQNGWELL